MVSTTLLMTTLAAQAPQPPAVTTSMGLALLAGLLTVLSPCVLPILPVVVGRSLQSHPYGPVALVTGLIGGFATTGSLLGITASWFTGLTNGLRTVAIALLLILGALAIVPKWSYCLFSYLPIDQWINRSSSRIHPNSTLSGEFWLGTQLGLLWTPCAGPVLGSILVLAAVQHQALTSFGLLLVYGIGAGLPLLAIAYSSRATVQRLRYLQPHSTTIQRLGGIVIVLTAIAMLQGWDVQLQLWLAPLFPQLPL